MTVTLVHARLLFPICRVRGATDCLVAHVMKRRVVYIASVRISEWLVVQTHLMDGILRCNMCHLREVIKRI